MKERWALENMFLVKKYCLYVKEPCLSYPLHACLKGKSIVKMYMYCINENLTPRYGSIFSG